MSLKILATGDTFDKECNKLDGKLFFRRTHMPEMLKLGPRVTNKTIILTGAMVPYSSEAPTGCSTSEAHSPSPRRSHPASMSP